MANENAVEEQVVAAVEGQTSEQQPTEAVAEETAGTEETTQEKKPKKGGFVRKIERLETQLEAERRQNRELLDRLAGKTADKPTAADDAEPQLSSFETYELYLKALTAWTVRQEAKKYTETQASADAEKYQKQINREFSSKVAEFVDAHPDYDDVLSESVPLYQGVEWAIKEMENGPEVAYFLGKHTDIADKLMGMSPARAIAEVGKISAQLSPPERKKPVSNAPPPAKPLGGGSAVTDLGKPGERSLAEYRRLRESGQL